MDAEDCCTDRYHAIRQELPIIISRLRSPPFSQHAFVGQAISSLQLLQGILAEMQEYEEWSDDYI